MPQCTVIIATALSRTDLLVSRCLRSVYIQSNVNPVEIDVIIVDDNPRIHSNFSDEFDKIKNGVAQLRLELGLPSNNFRTTVTPNIRTQGNSGTGAWNTGIYRAYEQNPKEYVSILDDDDEYLPNHLSNCLNQIDAKVSAVFQPLFWFNSNETIFNFPITLDDISEESFFIGNPGVQGSNMFFKTDSLIAISGFDEDLPNTTDRDLMIRFIQSMKERHSDYREAIRVLKDVGVKHYNHTQQKVNNDLVKKHLGLDLFYQKHRQTFASKDYEASLKRAQILFNYTPQMPSAQ